MRPSTHRRYIAVLVGYKLPFFQKFSNFFLRSSYAFDNGRVLDMLCIGNLADSLSVHDISPETAALLFCQAIVEAS